MKNKKRIWSVMLTAAMFGSFGAALPAAAEEGMYRSELTNEWIDASLENQRPVAVTVDNEVLALDHFGVNQGDIVYEIMNSTANNRITRLMVLVKDWANIQQLGSIRSARPTNFMLAAEYNAILVHDGGPYFIDEYVKKDYSNNLSGGFARVPNGKDLEFTEYVTSDDYTNPETGEAYAGLCARIAQSGYSATYNEYYPGRPFSFSDEDQDFSWYETAFSVNQVLLPFPHNASTLTYDASSQTYLYSEYGEPHIDALDGTVTSFKNVILQNCDFTQLDQNGYMVYDLMDSTVDDGYYLSNGTAIPITWNKDEEDGLTCYTNATTGEPLVLNTGKTYIGIVPSDSWYDLVLQ